MTGAEGGGRLSGLGGNRQEGKGEGYTMHLLDVGKMDVVKLVGGGKKSTSKKKNQFPPSEWKYDSIISQMNVDEWPSHVLQPLPLFLK